MFKWIFLFLPFFSYSQNCDYFVQYSGKPGYVDSSMVDCAPNAEYLIDVQTLNIPDNFELHVGPYKYVFDTGGDYVWNHNGLYGYNEFIISPSTTDTLLISSDLYPIDFLNGNWNYFPMGAIRIHLFTDVYCKFFWKLSGNKTSNTDYLMCISEQINGKFETDTIYKDVCESLNPAVSYSDCRRKYNIYRDSSIYDVPQIINASCDTSHDGSIIFSHNPKKNVYNSAVQSYQIAVQNSICSKVFNLYVGFDKLCGDIYIPNIVSNDINGSFNPFTIHDVIYDLEIYDRWGSLIFKAQNLLSNRQGWTPPYNISGVFVYKIVCLNHCYSGSVTVLK